MGDDDVGTAPILCANAHTPGWLLEVAKATPAASARTRPNGRCNWRKKARRNAGREAASAGVTPSRQTLRHRRQSHAHRLPRGQVTCTAPLSNHRESLARPTVCGAGAWEQSTFHAAFSIVQIRGGHICGATLPRARASDNRRRHASPGF